MYEQSCARKFCIFDNLSACLKVSVEHIVANIITSVIAQFDILEVFHKILAHLFKIYFRDDAVGDCPRRTDSLVPRLVARHIRNPEVHEVLCVPFKTECWLTISNSKVENKIPLTGILHGMLFDLLRNSRQMFVTALDVYI